MSENAEVAQIVRGRGAFYEYFSLAYRKPADKDFLELCKQFAPFFTAVASEVDIPILAEGANGLKKFAANITNDEEFLNSLNRSYTSLFLLGHTSVPTSESVYLSPEKLLKQDPWEAVMKLYAKSSFGIPVSFKEPEDHVSIEMLYMSFLAGKCADALDAGNDEEAEKLMEEQKFFLFNHIMKWVPTFCDGVLKIAKNREIHLMEEITALLKGFLEYDCSFFDTMFSEE